MSVYIYWSCFFPVFNFPVYKLSRVAFFRYSLLPPKQFLTPFALKHCPQRKPFKTLGNNFPSKALFRMLERCLSIYTGPDSFPYTNFPVYKLSRIAFFRHYLLPQKHILTLLLSSIVRKENPLRHQRHY